MPPLPQDRSWHIDRPAFWAEDFPEGYEDDEHEQAYRGDARAWHPEAREEPQRAGGALNEIDVLVEKLHGRLHTNLPRAHVARVSSLVSPAHYARLLELVEVWTPAGEFPEEVADFMTRHGLAWALPSPIEDIARLALRVVGRLNGLKDPAEVAWGAVGEALARVLASAPESALLEPVLLAFHETIFEGPARLRRALAILDWHRAWLPLVPWLAASMGLGDAGLLTLYPRGSWLALSCVKHNVAHLARLPGASAPLLDTTRTSGAGSAGMLATLGAGGGSLQGLDYPSFTLASRASMIEMTPEQLTRALEIQGQLAQVHAAARYPRNGLPILFSLVAPRLWSSLPAPTREALCARLLRLLGAYLGLRRQPATATGRLRRAQLLAFWQRPLPVGFEDEFRQLPYHLPEEQILEGLALAMLCELHQPVCEEETLQHQLKEALIEGARLVAACYDWRPLSLHRAEGARAAGELLDGLLRCFDHAPLELLQALGMEPRQGLPKLQGGQVSALEGRFRALLREVTRGRRKDTAEQAVVFHCRPIPKEQALYRGELGHDCSSRSVPLRALSPHHVYYGFFRESGEQIDGYATVYEAWAATADGQHLPVLCLETINEPRQLLAGVQQDLLAIFEAIARQRGLHPGLVLSVQHGTWNYINGRELARCRRVRGGAPVWLAPADPVVWRAYARFSGENGHYSAFDDEPTQGLLRPSVRGQTEAMCMLAALDPQLDLIQPENAEEVRRILAMPRLYLRETCRDVQGLVGFISGATAGEVPLALDGGT